MRKSIIALLLLMSAPFCWAINPGVPPEGENHTMLFADSTRTGIPFSKDPHVVSFYGKYLMYYSVPPKGDSGWGIGIAESRDLVHWQSIGILSPAADYEAKGLCAPSALLRNDTIHLFYQTYGNGKKDAICHAWSVDGVHFTRNTTNPIFAPKAGDWNCGRAIDAEVVFVKGKYFLYYATRTPDFEKYQFQSGDVDRSLRPSYSCTRVGLGGNLYRGSFGSGNGWYVVYVLCRGL